MEQGLEADCSGGTGRSLVRWQRRSGVGRTTRRPCRPGVSARLAARSASGGSPRWCGGPLRRIGAHRGSGWTMHRALAGALCRFFDRTARRQRPQRCGTAVGEGDSSRGVRRVAGKAPVDRVRVLAPGRGRPGGPETRRNPDRQRDATGPHLSSGENRRGGAKPRGRNGTSGRGWPEADATGWRHLAAGVDAREHVGGGNTGESHERRPEHIRAGRRRGLWRGAEARTAGSTFRKGRAHRRTAEHLAGAPGNGRTPGGSGKANDPLRSSPVELPRRSATIAAVQSRYFTSRRVPRTVKVGPTSREPRRGHRSLGIGLRGGGSTSQLEPLKGRQDRKSVV